ncbi:MAG: preprotein translocase subunit YajC [Acidobacteriota bacterium]|nr:preprotein translocase subunit YajC [Acidobacteriota bacterium]
MHLIILAQTTTPTTVAKSSKSSGSYVPLLVIIVIFALVYFLFLRPRQQRMRQQAGAGRQIAVGDEVMTAGGIFGTVVALDVDAVEVEVSPGVVMTFLPRAVSLRQQPGRGGRTAAAPTDAPWTSEPDGPGDTAGPHDTGGHDSGSPSGDGGAGRYRAPGEGPAEPPPGGTPGA